MVSSVASLPSVTTVSIEPQAPPDDDDDNVPRTLTFLRIFKEHHHLIDKSCRDFWKIVTEKCHDEGIYGDKTSTNMYMDIWPAFVEHSKANFQTDTQTEIDKMVMEIVVSRKPGSFVKKAPLTARQRAVANYHPPKIGIVEPGPCEPLPGRPKKTPTKTAPTLSRNIPRPAPRASMNPIDAMTANNSRANGNNVLVSNPPPLPFTSQQSLIGLHQNRTPHEALLALMHQINYQANAVYGQQPTRMPAVQPSPRPRFTRLPPPPLKPLPPPAPPSPLPPPPSTLPPPIASASLAPAPPSAQSSLSSVESNPGTTSVRDVSSDELPPPSEPLTRPSASLESNIPPVPDNVSFLHYLATTTSCSLPFGLYPFGIRPAWLQPPDKSLSTTPLGLTAQQIHLESLRTSVLMNPLSAEAGYSFGGQTCQKLNEILGHSGAHGWIPSRALPTPSQEALDKFMFNKITGVVGVDSDTSTQRTSDMMGMVSNPSQSTSSMFSTSSLDPFYLNGFALPSMNALSAAAEILKNNPPLTSMASFPPTAMAPFPPLPPPTAMAPFPPLPPPTAISPLPPPPPRRSATPYPRSPQMPRSRSAAGCLTKSNQSNFEEIGAKKRKLQEVNDTSPSVPVGKQKRTNKRKTNAVMDTDSYEPAPSSKRQKSVTRDKVAVKVPKKRGPKPKATRAASVVPVRQSVRLAIRMSLDEKMDELPVESVLKQPRSSRTRSVGPDNWGVRRDGPRSRTYPKIIGNDNGDNDDDFKA